MVGIKVLEYHMINKIAAGEVVERPASVVKELVENAIDAGSSNITVEIRDGGIGYIRVSDNGCGIPSEEVKNAFLRHATSKISTMEDLEKVLTLGFRGEALSSIASVAQVEILTKTSDEMMGTKLVIHGGEVISQTQAGTPDGTSIIVENLFYNTPARRKFLKKPAQERGYISDVMAKIAVGRPEVAFKCIVNGVTELQTKGHGDLKTAVFHVFGKDMAKNMLSVEYEKDGFLLYGLTGRPESARANRTYENFFINGRSVISPIVQRGAEDAYKTLLMTGRFPVFVLNLRCPPDFVDVNVHPAKREVRFGNEDVIYSLVYQGVSHALKSQNLIQQGQRPVFSKVVENYQEYKGEQPELAFKPAVTLKEGATAYQTGGLSAHLPPVTYIQLEKQEQERETSLYDDKKVPDGKPPANVLEPEPAIEPKKIADPQEKSPVFFANYKIVGQFFSTYWVVERGEAIYLIDQHAAHERVLFERLKARFTSGSGIVQKLAVPIAIRLSPSEMATAEENRELLEGFGFEFEELDESAYALRAVPDIFQNPAETSFFTEIIDRLTAGEKPGVNPYERKWDDIAAIACKAAVKANDRLGYGEAKELIEAMMRLENPFTCPHGRPTIIEMTKYQIEKMFKRVP